MIAVHINRHTKIEATVRSATHDLHVVRIDMREFADDVTSIRVMCDSVDVAYRLAATLNALYPIAEERF